MIETLHSQDIFKTITIPHTEHHLAMCAKHLLDGAHQEALDLPIDEHLSRTVTGDQLTQAFWEYQNNEARTYDRLAITAMYNTLTIGLEHRDAHHTDQYIRSSLLMYNGISETYLTDAAAHGHAAMASRSEKSIQTFKQHFFTTTAGLGLSHQIQRLDQTQNESSSASFASAA